jgi:two-component system chemotaxis response regulator CheB
LWEIEEGSVARFRCPVGHIYSEQSMLNGQAMAADGALWVALRALEEREKLLRRVVERARRGSRSRMARQFEEHAAETGRQIELLHAALRDNTPAQWRRAAGIGAAGHIDPDQAN